MTAPLVLASASPQRRGILEGLGLAFEARPAAVEEGSDGPPAAVSEANARLKALAVARPGELVLGVDTVVALDGLLWGKPADEDGAASTLRALSGRTHEVVSGFALVDDGAVSTGHEVTLVTFRELDEATIAWYVGAGEWRDRAGAYAVQGRGATLVSRIEGDYLNVVGLPIAALEALRVLGFPAVFG